jgi:hypothetical protein
MHNSNDRWIQSVEADAAKNLLLEKPTCVSCNWCGDMKDGFHHCQSFHKFGWLVSILDTCDDWTLDVKS